MMLIVDWRKTIVLERNEALMFTETEVAKIEEALNNFSIIATNMGIDIVTTGIKLTTDREVIELSYIGREGKRCQYYEKSVVKTWDDVLNNIEADLFGELKRMCH